MEYAPYFMGDKVLENQMVYLPYGNGKVAFLLRSEMAEIAAKMITSEGHENKIYNLSGEETNPEISQLLGRKPVSLKAFLKQVCS